MGGPQNTGSCSINYGHSEDRQEFDLILYTTVL